MRMNLRYLFRRKSLGRRVLVGLVAFVLVDIAYAVYLVYGSGGMVPP
jgi:hypothetical protein